MAGSPMRVCDAHGVVEIAVRCSSCGADWTLTAAIPPLILRPKPDRRAPK
jgi:hypothetical protein